MIIGSIDLGKYPVLLAPMEDVTDIAFRVMCKRFGVDMVYTEFVSADALVRDVKKTWAKLEIAEEERPVVIQIYGKDPVAMAEAAARVEEAKPDIIDINFGCPVRKIATKGAGAGLLRDIPRMIEITKAVVDAVKTPVTAKTRLGWDSDSLQIVEIAEQLQDVGIAALAIHGRTRCQMYTGQADWTLIGEVKNNPRMHIPIIGNGDITTPQRAKECFDKYGVDAIMVGRATIGMPWIFSDIKNYLLTGELNNEYSFAQKIGFLRQQIDNAIARTNERSGILHTRRHMAATQAFKGLRNFRPMRIRMLQAQTYVELMQILDEIEHTDWTKHDDEILIDILTT